VGIFDKSVYQNNIQVDEMQMIGIFN